MEFILFGEAFSQLDQAVGLAKEGQVSRSIDLARSEIQVAVSNKTWPLVSGEYKGDRVGSGDESCWIIQSQSELKQEIKSSDYSDQFLKDKEAVIRAFVQPKVAKIIDSGKLGENSL